MSKTPLHTDFLTCDEMLTLGMCAGELLDALEEDLGPEAVWKLASAYGGRIVYVPKRRAIRRSIATERLGSEIVTWLFDRLGYGNTQIPMGSHSRTARNMAAFRTAFLQNKSHAQVAQEMNCCTRTVERMAARLRDAGFI